MTKAHKKTKHERPDRRVRVRGIQRKNPDPKRIGEVVVALALAVLLASGLPESIRFAALLANRRDEAKRLLRKLAPALDNDIDVVSHYAPAGKATVLDLFAGGRGVATLCLWIAFFMSLLNVYLAINWLPTSLEASGYTAVQASGMTTVYQPPNASRPVIALPRISVCTSWVPSYV